MATIAFIYEDWQQDLFWVTLLLAVILFAVALELVKQHRGALVTFMDGWKGDLAQWAVVLMVVGAMIAWLRWKDAQDRRKKADREELRQLSQRMVRDFKEQDELERMYRLSGQEQI